MSTLNQNQPATAFALDYMTTLKTVYGFEQAFAESFQELQIKTGVRQNETAFLVKTNNTPVIIQAYDTTKIDTADSRFGPLNEIKYEDTEAKYKSPTSFNELIDEFTVNNDLEDAIAERFFRIAREEVMKMNVANGLYLSTNAANAKVISEITDATVTTVFNELSEYQTNKLVVGQSIAYVRPDLYNKIVDLGLTTTGKNSKVNIDTNTIVEFKDFLIKKTPAQFFQANEIAYIAPRDVAINYVGIETVRTHSDSRYAGLLLQGASKTGSFILDDNKVAISKVTLTPIGG